MTAPDLLTKRREVTTDWLVVQSESLLDIAMHERSHTALVYAALEARSAIERVVFELIGAAINFQFTIKMLEECRKKDGVFRVLSSVMPDYRLHLQFTNLVLEVDDADFRCAELDIKKCRSLWSALAQYCHFLQDPKKTIEAQMESWLAQGIATVKEANGYLRTLLTEGRLGVLPVANMSLETRTIFNKFVKGKIGRREARQSLELMTPGLRMRSRFN